MKIYSVEDEGLNWEMSRALSQTFQSGSKNLQNFAKQKDSQKFLGELIKIFSDSIDLLNGMGLGGASSSMKTVLNKLKADKRAIMTKTKV
jgi:hypothetical protein